MSSPWGGSRPRAPRGLPLPLKKPKRHHPSSPLNSSLCMQDLVRRCVVREREEQAALRRALRGEGVHGMPMSEAEGVVTGITALQRECDTLGSCSWNQN